MPVSLEQPFSTTVPWLKWSTSVPQYVGRKLFKSKDDVSPPVDDWCALSSVKNLIVRLDNFGAFSVCLQMKKLTVAALI